MTTDAIPEWAIEAAWKMFGVVPGSSRGIRTFEVDGGPGAGGRGFMLNDFHESNIEGMVRTIARALAAQYERGASEMRAAAHRGNGA